MGYKGGRADKINMEGPMKGVVDRVKGATLRT